MRAGPARFNSAFRKASTVGQKPRKRGDWRTGCAPWARDPVRPASREALGAEDIRRLLVEGDPDAGRRKQRSCSSAARRDHLERTIGARPALAAGRDVITDRFADSTRVYQGATRGRAARVWSDDIHAPA